METGSPDVIDRAGEAHRRQLRMRRPQLGNLPQLQAPDGYRLRTYRPGDEGSWAGIMGSPGGIGRAWTVDKVRRQLIDREPFDPSGLFFVTCDAEQGRPVASACAWRDLPEEQRVGMVHMVCALPEHRGRGLGQLVTAAVLSYLEQHGFRAAELSTDDFRLPAIRSYLRLGFVPVYLADPTGSDDHEVRWSALLAAIMAIPKAAV